MFLACFVTAVLAGAGLILLTPALVDPDTPVPVAVPVALGLVLLVGGLLARSARPDRT